VSPLPLPRETPRLANQIQMRAGLSDSGYLSPRVARLDVNCT